MNIQTQNIKIIGAYKGDDLIRFISEKLSLDESEVWNVIKERFFGDNGEENVIMNMIVEEEEFCNDEGTYFDILRTIHEDIGGDIVVNFMSDYIILFDGGTIE